ncbi:MAG: tripartite tricarboxylate transporter substrate binding protein [Betaproteobacteria bacterium]|nr:tripartite tricarboxylate transporter substrate binding protein [Betaproteobacteria bacterium]
MRLFVTTISIALLTAAAQTASAQVYPTKLIRIVTTAAAGGGQDFVARLVAQLLSPRLGQTIIVENRVGATGAIGIEFVAKAPPDGYTLLLGAAGPLTASPALVAKLPFDTLRDFAPITVVASSPFTVSLHPSVPAKSLKELIALAKAKPGALNFGSAGTGSSPHLAAELLKWMAGINMTHIPYKSLAPAITDLLGGQIDMVIADVNLVLPHVNAGKLRVLAVTSPARSSVMPEIPTVSEAGIRGYAAGTWYGVLAPAGTSPEIVQRLHGEIVNILGTSLMRERLFTQGSEPVGNTPEQFTALLRSDIEKWRKLVKTANITVQ